MSHIAAALAKSKGKNVAPPPADSGPSTPPLDVTQPPVPGSAHAAPAGSADKPQGRLYGVLAGVILLGAGAWFLLGHRAHPAPPPATVPPQTAPATTKVAASPTPAAATVAPAPAPAAPPATPASAAPAEAYFAAVRQFNIRAVMTGANPRAMIDGKLYHLGDTVPPGLVLAEVREGQLIFRDNDGREYPRRF